LDKNDPPSLLPNRSIVVIFTSSNVASVSTLAFNLKLTCPSSAPWPQHPARPLSWGEGSTHGVVWRSRRTALQMKHERKRASLSMCRGANKLTTYAKLVSYIRASVLIRRRRLHASRSLRIKRVRASATDTQVPENNKSPFWRSRVVAPARPLDPISRPSPSRRQLAPLCACASSKPEDGAANKGNVVFTTLPTLLWATQHIKLERALGRAHTFAAATCLVLGMRVWGA